MKALVASAVLSALTFASAGFAQVDHVDSQCPDLNGTYATGDEYEQMRVQTLRGDRGEFRFGVAFYSGGWVPTDPVDGIPKKESDAGSTYRYACNSQKIYLYRDGKDVQMETRWYLDAARNLVEEVINKGVGSRKVYSRIGN